MASYNGFYCAPEHLTLMTEVGAPEQLTGVKDNLFIAEDVVAVTPLVFCRESLKG